MPGAAGVVGIFPVRHFLPGKFFRVRTKERGGLRPLPLQSCREPELAYWNSDVTIRGELFAIDSAWMPSCCPTCSDWSLALSTASASTTIADAGFQTVGQFGDEEP